jgi:hypothetical protein
MKPDANQQGSSTTDREFEKSGRLISLRTRFGPARSERTEGKNQEAFERDEFINDLDQLLCSNEPESLDKALHLIAQYLEMSPENIVAECFSRPSGSLRNKLGRWYELRLT